MKHREALRRKGEEMRKPGYKLVASTIILCTLFAAWFPTPIFATDEAEAHSSITAAEEKILECYKAAREANKAGANVTTLLSTLNKAGESLSKAKVAYTQGNYSLALNLSRQSMDMLNDFVTKAEELKTQAEQARHWDFMVNIVGSSVGAVALIVASFILWTLLKKREESKEKT